MSAPGAAGGRIGAIGERKIHKLYCFRFEAGDWIEICEIEGAVRLDRFELPYHAVGLSVTMLDGTERVVTGVIDDDLLQRYDATI
jgi:hypothetical protein